MVQVKMNVGLMILFAVLLQGCQNHVMKNYRVHDWTESKLFTEGIEGPAVDSQGNLFVVNFRTNGTIGKIDDKGNTISYAKLPKGSIGNGIRFNQNGDMFVADYKRHNILKIDSIDKSISVFSHSDKMNQPNDLAIMRNGTLFASDPDWTNNTGQLWRIDRDGTNHLLEKNMGTANGIEVANDQKHLYVNESVQRKVWVYDIASDYSLSNKRLLIEFNDFGLDGMRSDTEGNLYIARYGKGVIAIVSATGKLIDEIHLKGKFPTNIAFGGKSGKQVFVTMQKRRLVETFYVLNSGASRY